MTSPILRWSRAPTPSHCISTNSGVWSKEACVRIELDCWACKELENCVASEKTHQRIFLWITEDTPITHGFPRVFEALCQEWGAKFEYIFIILYTQRWFFFQPFRPSSGQLTQDEFSKGSHCFPRILADHSHWLGLLWWLSGKEAACQCRRHRFDPWFRKIPHATSNTTIRVCALEFGSHNYWAHMP